MIRTTGQRWLSLIALSALAVATTLAVACGDDDDDNGDETAGATTTRAATQVATTPDSGSETPEATTAGTPGAPAPGGDTTILIGDGGALGQILTSADGLTLYTFTNDTAGSNASACEGACANAWPALTVDGEPTAPAEAAGELGTITRQDGSSQVTYNGLPLYRFINDTAPGQTNGHEVGGVWFVAEP